MNAIEFENISKQYKLGYISTKTLSHDLNRWWTVNVLHKDDPYLKIGSVNDRSQKADSDYVWALKDINFNIEQGDVVGIIGKNGAGKSTLLKLLSRVTAPTTGEIRARGRIASLLEVGTGFHTELTGRENIYMNGSIMGMTKKEIKSKLDEIVDFAGVERYIDTPVKRYSSGMMVRLGFAVAAHLDPEILVVDEVLAVGDAEFQKKAIGKMQDVSKGEGRTVLFVSHNMASIKMLCTTGILMSCGKIEKSGKVADVVDAYLMGQLDGDQVDRKGTGKIRFEQYSVRQSQILIGDDLCFDIKLKVYGGYDSAIHINVCLFNSSLEPIVHTSNFDDDFSFNASVGETVSLQCVMRNVNVAPGKYTVLLWVGTSYETFEEIPFCMNIFVEQSLSYIKRPFPYMKKYPLVLQSKWKTLC